MVEYVLAIDIWTILSLREGGRSHDFMQGVIDCKVSNGKFILGTLLIILLHSLKPRIEAHSEQLSGIDFFEQCLTLNQAGGLIGAPNFFSLNR